MDMARVLRSAYPLMIHTKAVAQVSTRYSNPSIFVTHSRCTPMLRVDRRAVETAPAATGARELLVGLNGLTPFEAGRGPTKALAPPINIEQTTADFMMSPVSSLQCSWTTSLCCERGSTTTERGKFPS